MLKQSILQRRKLSLGFEIANKTIKQVMHK